MKKKSLLAATAMLLVALLAATGTTYAWFTQTASAKASISMNVKRGTSLEISLDEVNWKSSLSADDISPKIAGEQMWADFSTNANAIKDNQFYKANINTGTSDITGYALGQPANVTIHFRSTESGDVIFESGTEIKPSSFATTQSNLIQWSQIAVDDLSADENTVIYSNSSNTATKAVNGTTTDAVSGTYTSTALVNGVVVKMAKNAQDDGYYYGTATFYFFIEGTETGNGDVNGIGDAAQILASLVFKQAK